LDNSADEAWVDAAEAALHNAHKPLTAYSVFTGIGSSMQATERLHLPLKFIGYCEVDEDASTELLETLFPGIPNHGDVRNVIAALEAGELILKPDIVEMSSPCQGRSIARSLAESSEKQHPHHDLWFLQPKLISLLQPQV
jgi:site-specific DNA-cytosine methylase